MSNPPVRQEDLPPKADAEVQAQAKARRGRRKEEARGRRSKATYDLPGAMIEGIERIADDESVPRSDVVAWALADFLSRYDAGQVDWRDSKHTAVSLRWRWKLQLPGRWGDLDT